MPTPQSQLAERLADQFGLSAIRFRHFDSLVLADGPVLKLFVPRLRRMLGGRARDRMIDGELLFVPRLALKAMRAGSERFEAPDLVCGCPIANFPWLMGHAGKNDAGADPRLIVDLRQLVSLLPDDEPSWRALFGADVFARPRLETTVPLVAYLRESSPSPRA
ncbi:hypothetical protein ACLBKU_01370 [Erythrobacter sp. NE805]|uniref:hypothetical protein n=1 Tax=Erythrobacter sp. NE805 TaxID=3389875 RepID=UPI00396B16D0